MVIRIWGSFCSLMDQLIVENLMLTFQLLSATGLL